MKFIYDDGGRSAAGFRGEANDCVTRAIAIATGTPYAEVYADLFDRAKNFGTRRTRKAMRIRADASPRNRVRKEVYHDYLLGRGWRWKPLMHIGSGCKVHVRAEELAVLPQNAPLILRLSRHLAVYKDGAIRDTHDPSRDGARCVYGYYYPYASI